VGKASAGEPWGGRAFPLFKEADKERTSGKKGIQVTELERRTQGLGHCVQKGGIPRLTQKHAKWTNLNLSFSAGSNKEEQLKKSNEGIWKSAKGQKTLPEVGIKSVTNTRDSTQNVRV